MKSRILQSVVPVLFVIALTPALCRAQAEIDPDHFDSPVNVTTVAKKATLNPTRSQAYGSFFLPVDVMCSGAKLRSGYYSIAVRQLGKRNLVRLAPIVNGVRAQALEMMATPRLSPSARNELLVNRVNQRRTLTAISLEEAGVTLFLETRKESGISVNAELIPISYSTSQAFPAHGE